MRFISTFAAAAAVSTSIESDTVTDFFTCIILSMSAGVSINFEIVAHPIGMPTDSATAFRNSSLSLELNVFAV
jgi:hypothetical protein